MQKTLKNPDTTFIDVRNDWEFEEEHLPDAIHIPLEQVTSRLSEISKMHGPVVFYCRSGSRSGMAVRLLQQAGITNTYNGGGFSELKNTILN
jgi:phage shock protein E